MYRHVAGKLSEVTVSHTFSLLGFVAHLKNIEHDYTHKLPRIIIENAARMVATAAKNRLGKTHSDWPALSPETIADRVRQGFAPNKPGVRTGEMRDSIEYTIAPSGMEAQVGSNDQHLLWFELGSSRQPPRSVLVAAAQSVEDKIYRMAARATIAVLEGKGLHGSEFLELLHLLKDAGEHVKHELVDPLLHNEDEENSR
jgi:hypothetical protein